MLRTIVAAALIAGLTPLTLATTVSPAGAMKTLKCKAGFKPNSRKTRCIAVARPKAPTGTSSGGGSF